MGNERTIEEFTAKLVTRTPANANGGIKFDSGKDDWTLMPFDALHEVLNVLEFGAKKYARGNWVNVEADRYEKALLRHVIAHQKGEANDTESNIDHLAHAACNCLFLIWKRQQTEKANAEK